MKTIPFVSLAVLIGTCLMGTGANASPKWEPIMNNQDGLFFIDTQSITTEDGLKKVWSALDYKKPQTTSNGKTYMSLQSQVQVNCKRKMARVFHMTYYSGAMMTGDTVYRQGMLHEWMDIDPSSPIYKIARKIC
jgi:hypothetical protein